jgi:hydroxymethylpyrimidine/phosphomethylpyrimidine kinase
LTIAGSDSGGGAGIQADLKAFAAAGCYGTSAIVALTAQNTTGVSAVHEVPVELVEAQLAAVFYDIGVDAAKTGMLFSRRVIEAVADFLSDRPVPVVVDPVLVASSGARLLQDDAVKTLVERLFPLATVVTPNLDEAEVLAGAKAPRRELAERLHALGAAAVLVTGGHGDEAVDHLFDGERHVEIAVERHAVAATHGAGCTHSATLAAGLARIVDSENVGMTEARDKVDLSLETLGAKCDAKVGVQHFDRDVAIVLQVVRQIHCRHAAATEFLPDHVPVGKDGLGLYSLGHYGTARGKSVRQREPVPRAAVFVLIRVALPSACRWNAHGHSQATAIATKCVTYSTLDYRVLQWRQVLRA